jgi:hypothetical protein
MSGLGSVGLVKRAMAALKGGVIESGMKRSPGKT